MHTNPGVNRMPAPAGRQPHIRIIAGAWRSRKLSVPATRRTRPMPDRIRGSIFDILAARFDLGGMLPDFNVADLFAGSGGMGLEALSRGAAECRFVERGRPALRVLRDNISTLDAASACEILNADAWTAPLTTPRPESAYGLLFVDPPYADARDTSPGGRVPILLADLYRAGWADERSTLVLHHEADITWAPIGRAPWVVHDRRTHGGAAVTFLAHARRVEDTTGDKYPPGRNAVSNDCPSDQHCGEQADGQTDR